MKTVTCDVRRAGVLLVVLLLTGMSAAAQERLTLDEAIARALQHSAHLAELEARQAGASATGSARAADRRPVVAAQAGYTRTNHVDEYAIAFPGQPVRVLYPDVPDNFRSRLDLHWPIYTAGRVDALERAARAEAGAIGEDLAAAREELALEVTRAFWALVTAREAEAVLARSLERIDIHVGDLRVRLEQGLISPHELLATETQRSRQRLLAAEASAIRGRAEADIGRLTGLSDPVVPVVTPSPKADVAAAAGTALFRPEHRALERRVEAAREREAAAAAARKPQVVLGAGYDYARPNPRIFPRVNRWEDSWDVGVNVSWTLWDGGRRAAAEAEAAAATRAARARATAFSRQADFELRSRGLEVAAARAAVAAAEDGVRYALEARRVIDERYRAGVATSTDLVDAEGAVLQAELDRTRATASLRVAEAALRRAAGRP